MEENKQTAVELDASQAEEAILALKKKRIKQTRRMIASSIALIITTVIIFSVQTVAYFTDGADSQRNILQTGIMNVKLVESTVADESDELMSYPETPIKVMPSVRVSKIVTAYNTGNVDAWVRVKVEKTVKSLESGELMDVDADLFICDFNTDEWTLGDDGYWYYNATLKAGEITKPLFRSITFASEMDNSYANSTIMFEITVNAVQKNSNGTSPMEAVWPEEGTENN